MDDELVAAVGKRLAADGWAVRDLRQPYGVTMTRTTGTGVLLVVQLLPTWFHLSGRRRRRRPEEYRLRGRRLGRARVAGTQAAMLLRATRDLVPMVRGSGAWSDGAEPGWLRPPDRAGYRAPTRSRYVTVRLDATGRARLEQVRTQAARRLGPWVMVDAWLTRDPAGRISVHVGQEPVGTVDDDGTYDTAFAAAALFDEDPVLAARLVPDPQPALELPLPR